MEQHVSPSVSAGTLGYGRTGGSAGSWTPLTPGRVTSVPRGPASSARRPHSVRSRERSGADGVADHPSEGRVHWSLPRRL